LTSWVRLHQGPDHLLQVSSTGYSETYKRFYFRDIQAFLIVRTGYWTVTHILLGVFMLGGVLLSLIFFAAGGSGFQAAGVVMGVIAAVFALFLGISLLAGPACRCSIRTAVQTESLPSLSRLRRAQRVINQLRPLIEAEQAPLAAEPENADEPPVVSSEGAAPPVIQPPTPAHSPAPVEANPNAPIA
jgi:hypothetical protein